MVGDDQVHAQPPRGLGRSESADAHVHADDEPDARRGRALDDVVAHVVAFADAVRHVKIGRAAAELNGGLENDDGGGAIDVVVAVDQDWFFVLDGGFEAVDGRSSCRSSDRASADERVRESGNVSAASAFGDAAHDQQAGERRGDAADLSGEATACELNSERETFDCAGVSGFEVPAHG